MNLNKRFLIRFLSLSIIVIMIVALFYIYNLNNNLFLEHKIEDAKIESLQAEIEKEDDRSSLLKEKINSSSSNQNIEQVAREEFGFIKGDEIIIRPQK